MNRDLCDIHLSFLQIDANNVDFALRVDGVDVRLDELAAPDVLEVGGDQLLTNVDHFQPPTCAT